MKKVMTACFAGVLISLSGCATVKQPDIVDPTKEGLESRLEEYASSVSKSFRQLAEVEARASNQGATPSLLPASKKDIKIPDSLKTEVEFSWSGPIEGCVQKISNIAGYKLEVTGSEPTFPIIVSVSQTKISLFDLIYDIGYQAGKAVDIVLKPSQKVIEIRYPPITMRAPTHSRGPN